MYLNYKKINEESRKSDFMYEIKKEDLEKHFKDQTILTKTVEGKVVGFCGWKKIYRDWYELGPLFVFEEHQKNGYAQEMIHEVVQTLVDKNLYVITRSPVIKKILLRHNLKKVVSLRFHL